MSDFPADFTWGVSTSAFQIEGAATAGGRGESIWDRFTSRPGVIADGSDASIATDHYHKLEQDLDLVAGLGVGAYRFSTSWSRLTPTGRGRYLVDGWAFYDRSTNASATWCSMRVCGGRVKAGAYYRRRRAAGH